MRTADAREELDEALQTVRDLSRALQEKTDELAGERQRYADWFEHSPQPALILDEDGTILAANRAFLESIGGWRRSRR